MNRDSEFENMWGENMQISPSSQVFYTPSNSPVREEYINPASFYEIYSNIINRRLENDVEKRDGFGALQVLEIDIISSDLQTKIRDCAKFDYVTKPYGIINLSRLINTQPQNPILFNWLFCSIGKSYLTINKENELHYDWHINLYELRVIISAIEELSQAGAFGKVWDTIIKGLKGLLYLKTVKDPERDPINHEFFIGYCLNSLRPLIPNFMYVYGRFFCNKPENGNRVCPIPSDEGLSYNYLMMESIKPGISLMQAVVDFNFEQFMSVYLQIISAVGMAYERFDFTHYDLHSSNVLIQGLPTGEPIFIKYSLGGNEFYIKSGVIAKIIDYGLSHIRVKDDQNNVMDFGNITAISADFTQSNPFQDIYRLSGRLLHNLSTDSDVNDIGNMNLLRKVHNIITDFEQFRGFDSRFISNEEKFLSTLREENSDYFVINPIDIPDPFVYHLKYILHRYGNLKGTVFFSHLPWGSKILSCDNGQCAKVEQIHNIVTANQFI